MLAFVASIATGFALNRFVINKITPGPKRSIALALSRAIFYAPSLAHIGHGAYLPMPLSLAIFYLFEDFGTEIDTLLILLPGIVFIGSFYIPWLKDTKSRG